MGFFELLKGGGRGFVCPKDIVRKPVLLTQNTWNMAKLVFKVVIYYLYKISFGLSWMMFLISKVSFQIIIRNVTSLDQTKLWESHSRHYYFKITLKLKMNNTYIKVKAYRVLLKTTKVSLSWNGLCRVFHHIWCICGLFLQVLLSSFYDWHPLFDLGRLGIVFFS